MATAWGTAAYVKANAAQRMLVTVAGVYTGWLAYGPAGVIIDSTPPRPLGAASGWKLISDAKAACVGADDGWTVM
jgi:hypothetical protein